MDDKGGAVRRRAGPAAWLRAPCRRRALAYLWRGALLSQGAPLGALAFHALIDRRAALAHVAENPDLYLYMSVAAGVAFAVFGYRLGSVADDLLRQRRALRRANHRLKRLSEIDPLTRVLNRRAMHARLVAECTRAQRDGSTVALVMLDLDHFKRVNDLHGHGAGDRVLHRVGRHLMRLARATDSVGRVGGEEFLVVLPATGVAEAMSFAERLRLAIACVPRRVTTPAVTASAGVLVTLAPDPHQLTEILRQLDRALYRAKAEGRNRVCLSAPSLDASGITAGAH
jgi:diguanylate cyclase (GGDEF)-like protein